LRQTRHLYEEGKDMEAVELHAAAWRPYLEDLVNDPGPLLPLADTYQKMGLQHRAMSILGLAAEVQGRLQMDDQGTVLRIAALYLEMGHPDLATDALEVLKTRKLTAPVLGQATLLEGRIAEAQDQKDLARQRWTAAAQEPTAALEARARIALMDAAEGNCAAALDPLSAALDDLDLRQRLGEGVLRTYHARCLEQMGNPEGSTVAAFLAASSLHDPESTRYASWLSASTANKAEVPSPGGALESDPPDIWTLLAREDKSQDDFEKRLAELQH
jgi:hypothetical protein